MAVEKKIPARSGRTARTEGTAGFCVYLGPSISGLIQKGSVYPCSKGETLRRIADAAERYPEVAALVVPGNILPEARRKVQTPGNLLYEYYHRILIGAEKRGDRSV